MADENDDEWLYGNTDQNPTEEQPVEDDNSTDSGNDKTGETENVVLEPPIIPPLQKSTDNESEKEPDVSSEINKDTPETTEEQKDAEEGETAGEEKDKAKDSDEEEDDDDNINVVIGDLRTTPGYGPGLHIKRGNLLTLTKQPGKFTAEDFDSVGTINGVAAHEYNLDALEEKPWRKPGADISDYFNYGFNEETWKAYCERQKRLRIHESGAGLAQNNSMQPVVTVPPPTNLSHIPQVMTADRNREYTRKSFSQDMSVPPPMIPPQFQTMPPAPPPTYMPNTFGGPSEYYSTNMDPYYEPAGYNDIHETWMGPPPPQQQEWNSNNVRVISLTNSGGNSEMQQDYINGKSDQLLANVKIKQEPEDDYPDRDSYKDRDRHRERSHRRTVGRSPSRDKKSSRKHKSHSRSPVHRSHKKKKSKKSDRRSREGSSD